MLRAVVVLVLTAFFVTACNTMDGLVTDVNQGVNKLKGDEDHR